MGEGDKKLANQSANRIKKHHQSSLSTTVFDPKTYNTRSSMDTDSTT